MSWVKYLMNQEAISRLYGSVDCLDRLNVHEINLNREGPVLQVRADLEGFPEEPSKRWSKEANTAQVQIDFIGIEELKIQGFGVVNQGTLMVRPDGGQYQFVFQGTSSSIQGTCVGLRVSNVSAYTNSEDS